ncbi:maleylpyruvate isomerase N-terminal domain-containing protein [Cellulosimicrobium sp. Marseille-Q8652]
MDRSLFLATARSALELAARPEVAAAWSAESACEGMTVGGLTHHLLKQLANTRLVLEAPPQAAADVVGAHEHYARSAWVGADLDAPANVGVREASDAAAEDGPEAVLAWGREACDAVATLVDRPRTPDLVDPPWTAWAMPTDDFLTTRLVELTVHSDDLAASVGVPTPQLPEPVVDAVLDVLTTVAVRRHGQTAVLRALSRPQRAPANVSAF